MLRQGIRTAAMTAVFILSACNHADAPPAPKVNGLSAEDDASIRADAKARLLKRTRGLSVDGTLQLCTNFFSLGEPQIVDSALGEQTGKVKLLVPVIVQAPQTVNGQWSAPDIDCYGFSHPNWTLNKPYPVTFQFDVERWQSGWRVAQVQTSGF